MFFIAAIIFSACDVQIPDKYLNSNQCAQIYPDYTDISIPVNICPINFEIKNSKESIVRISSPKSTREIIVTGPCINIPEKEWKDLLKEVQGDSIYIDIFDLQESGQWIKYKTIRNAVEDSIDSYITYRLIPPSYVSYEKLSINQRNIENFEETVIYSNQPLATPKDGQCINCHVPQNYNKDGNFQFHIRQEYGGTLIGHNGTLKKINLKTDSTISSGVYPAWHPNLPLIAYSVNTTTQNFHSKNPNKVEVQDAASDIILYNVDNDKISFISNDPTALETFPAWSPDGQWLYYVSADMPSMSQEEIRTYQSLNYKDFKYNIFRRRFDPVSFQFGAADTVYMASEKGMSATLPRISPNGRYLMFTMGEYGTFHIWHKDSDLYIMDLISREVLPLNDANSDDVESYHSWSSSGDWVIFSSRRDDGSFTRLYISKIDKDGKSSKPFLLPQKYPNHNVERMESYNVPEFMVKPFHYSLNDMIETVKKEPFQVIFE